MPTWTWLRSVNWKILGPLLVTSALTILGWLAAHRFSVSRDQSNRRAEERVRHLVGAYQTLAQIRGHDHAWKLGDDIRIAIAGIQLFGTEEQIKNTVAWIKAAESRKNIAINELDVLLESLRRHLRAEISLDPVSEKLWWVRIGPPKEEG